MVAVDREVEEGDLRLIDLTEEGVGSAVEVDDDIAVGDRLPETETSRKATERSEDSFLGERLEDVELTLSLFSQREVRKL